jgi:hypothetical protein
MGDIVKLIVYAVLILALIAAGPLLVIWSLNTLFPALEIAYSISTWFATLILGVALNPTVRIKKD